MTTIIDINELRTSTAPFEDFPSLQYISTEAVLDTNIKIKNARVFENHNGLGAYAHIILPNGHEGYLCTHSLGLVNVLGSINLRAALNEGKLVEARIVKRKSQKSDRMVYAFA